MSPQPDRSVVRRIGAFAVAPFLSLLTPLLTLPAIASSASTASWASLAIGQSIGALASIVIAFGWPLLGPVEVARGSSAQVQQTYFESLVTRGALFPLVMVPTALVCWVAAPAGHLTLTLAMAAASASFGLSASWVAIGLGKASSLVFYDVLPRLVFGLATVLLITQGAPLLWYPALLAVSTIVGLLLFGGFCVRPTRTATTSPLEILRSRLVTQLSAATTAMAGSAYSTGALLIVGLSTTVHQTAIASSADRLYRIGLFAVIALTNAFQGWVVHPEDVTAHRRRLGALKTHVALGLTGGALLAVAAPAAATLLFGSRLAPGYDVSVPYGIAFAIIAPTSSLGQHFLVPAGRINGVLISTLMGAAVGVPALVLLSHRYGAPGAASGLALSEACVLVSLAVQARHLHRPLRRDRKGTAQPSHRVE